MKRYRLVLYPLLVLLVAGALAAERWWHQPRYDGERLATWLDRVNDADSDVRGKAATALGELGRDSDDAWTALARMTLHEKNDDARANAVAALKTLCQSNTPKDDPKRLSRKRSAIQTLLDGLKDAEATVRRRAPEALFEAAGLRFYGHAIRRSLDDAVDEEMRPAVVRALIAALDDEDSGVRAEVQACLEGLGPKAVPELREALQAASAKARPHLRDCLKTLGADDNL
jgi:HEAT repeat protein